MNHTVRSTPLTWDEIVVASPRNVRATACAFSLPVASIQTSLDLLIVARVKETCSLGGLGASVTPTAIADVDSAEG